MKKICLIIIALSTFACKHKSKAVYNLSIPKEKLIHILIDKHIAEMAVDEHISQNKDSLKNLYFTEIYTIHKINPEILQADISKLEKDVILYEEILRNVIDSIKKIQTYKYRPEVH
jgi:hypothetical protein